MTEPNLPLDTPPAERAANRNAFWAYVLALGGVLTVAATLAPDGFTLAEGLQLAGTALGAFATAAGARAAVGAREATSVAYETLAERLREKDADG